jgi:hypothetical protein
MAVHLALQGTVAVGEEGARLGPVFELALAAAMLLADLTAHAATMQTIGDIIFCLGSRAYCAE